MLGENLNISTEFFHGTSGTGIEKECRLGKFALKSLHRINIHIKDWKMSKWHFF